MSRGQLGLVDRPGQLGLLVTTDSMDHLVYLGRPVRLARLDPQARLVLVPQVPLVPLGRRVLQDRPVPRAQELLVLLVLLVHQVFRARWVLLVQRVLLVLLALQVLLVQRVQQVRLVSQALRVLGLPELQDRKE